ncbi:MAG: serine/threonine protein phosphatase [bacterium]|nr:serine/threonine protein phosphatase [bacterium]
MPPGVHENTRIYAIGDIHGCHDLLKILLDQIAAHDLTLPRIETKILVFLGDYVDRGENSKAVIDILLNNCPQGYETVFLKGNHEEMLLNALNDKGTAGFWLRNGGRQTIASYGFPGAVNHDEFTQEQLMEEFRGRLPQEHLAFLANLQLTYECGDYFFTHAGIHPDKPLDQQEERHLLWIRDPFLFSKEDFGKVIVHGHTPTRDVDNVKNRIGIDTAAVYGGKLTALMLEASKQIFLCATAPPKKK